jgi:hypothetical protein
MYRPVRFPKQEHGKAVKRKIDRVHAGEKVRKTTQRARKHDTHGTRNCTVCGRRYNIGDYYEHTKTAAHMSRRYR